MNDHAQTSLLKESADLDLPVGRREAVRRINRAMDYINEHLAEPLDLRQLAAQAHFSPYHFVRVFAAATGETPVLHLRRVRLARAAVLLYAWPEAPIVQIALATGFQSAAVFARALRLEFGMNASAWRRFSRWLIAHDLRGPDAVLFAQLLDGPYITAPRHYRYDAGLLIDETFRPDRYVNTRELPGGWFVAASFTGRAVDEAVATNYLRRVWLPTQSYIPSGAPHYICVPRRDNSTLIEPGLENLYRCTYYLPVIPPKAT